MVHKRGKRSRKKQEQDRQRYLAHKFLIANARLDRNRAELVNLTDRDMLISFLKDQGCVDLRFVDVERGEVLVDSRGKGSLQRIN